MEAHEANFKPSKAMRRFACACVSPDVPPDDEARCRAAGVSVGTLRSWRADPHFSEWLRSEIERLLSERVWEVWVVVHRLAREGNLQAAKLHLARFDPGADASRLHAAAPDTFRALAQLALDEKKDACESLE